MRGLGLQFPREPSGHWKLHTHHWTTSQAVQVSSQYFSFIVELSNIISPRSPWVFNYELPTVMKGSGNFITVRPMTMNNVWILGRSTRPWAETAARRWALDVILISRQLVVSILWAIMYTGQCVPSLRFSAAQQIEESSPAAIWMFYCFDSILSLRVLCSSALVSIINLPAVKWRGLNAVITNVEQPWSAVP